MREHQKQDEQRGPSNRSLSALAAILAGAFLRMSRARKTERPDHFHTPSTLAISDASPLSVTPGGLTPPEKETR